MEDTIFTGLEGTVSNFLIIMYLIHHVYEMNVSVRIIQLTDFN
jgi:hypothetical protein